MDIQGHASSERAKARRADITKRNREAIADSNPPLTPGIQAEIEAAEKKQETRQSDRVEVSETGRQVSERVAKSDRVDDRRRAERIRELTEAHRAGELNSSARIEQAALKMLENE